MRSAFLQELDLLQRSTEQDIATTLLAFPHALHDFADYLWFLDDAQELLQEAGLEGVVQLASFHPQYRFAGEAPDAASHYSNRAPYPLIHLLREDMLSRVLEDVCRSGADSRQEYRDAQCYRGGGTGAALAGDFLQVALCFSYTSHYRRARLQPLLGQGFDKKEMIKWPMI